MKKTWIILRFVGFFVCLFIFISNVRGMRTEGPEINKAKTEASQAWDNLERAAPLLTKEYNSAIKKEREVVAAHSSYFLWATIALYPLAYFSASLLWQFVIIPIKT